MVAIWSEPLAGNADRVGAPDNLLSTLSSIPLSGVALEDFVASGVDFDLALLFYILRVSVEPVPGG